MSTRKIEAMPQAFIDAKKAEAEAAELAKKNEGVQAEASKTEQ